MIGNTPLIKIEYKYQNEIKEIFVKLEYYNLTGSVKDRMADYIIKKAKEKHILKENMPIVEASSGNTGISLAALGAKYNHPVHIFLPDWVSSERTKLLKMYGAKVYFVSKKEGGYQKAIELADNLAKKINGFRPNQFSNPDNTLAHYHGLGKEILNSLDNIGAFISGIGTGGTLMGVGSKLKEFDPEVKLIALEPKSLAIMSAGNTLGAHKIEGIGDDFIPEIINQRFIDKIIQIDDNDAINMARILSKKLGLGVGISSGANFLAAVIVNKQSDKKIVTIFPDDNKKYISTQLSKNIDNNKTFLSNNLELMNYEIV